MGRDMKSDSRAIDHWEQECRGRSPLPGFGVSPKESLFKKGFDFTYMKAEGIQT